MLIPKYTSTGRAVTNVAYIRRLTNVDVNMWILFSATLLALSVAGACPAGFESLGQSCYVILKVVGSYDEAQMYCEMVGASLAVIRSREEEKLIDSYIHRHMSQIQEDEIWIGGTDLLQEGTFLDPKTQEVLIYFLYFNWAPNPPDNYGTGEHCIDIFRDDAQLRWNDELCNTDRVPLCKREQMQPVTIVG